MIVFCIIASFIIAYLLGNVLLAQIIGIFFLKTNLRTVGSGNVGSTNLTRIGGK
jgi:glycerol-3-phosphate acyltransferase PlsY